MKERFLDVIKWGLILMIAGIVFYVVFPKYYFSGPQGAVWFKGNKITGQVYILDTKNRKWKPTH